MLEITTDDLRDTLKAYGRETDPIRKFNLYKAVRARWDDLLDMPLRAAGDLVVQRTLELLKVEFPMLSAVTTDFSAEPESRDSIMHSPRQHFVCGVSVPYLGGAGWFPGAFALCAVGLEQPVAQAVDKWRAVSQPLAILFQLFKKANFPLFGSALTGAPKGWRCVRVTRAAGPEFRPPKP